MEGVGNLKDAEGFDIRCIYSDWKIIDGRDNKDYVCTRYFTAGNHICYCDNYCKDYKPITRREPEKMVTISEEKWKKVKKDMCEDYCYFANMSSEEVLEKHCEECPLNMVDNPLGYCPHQE